jgi:NDP-sugar pyrophosphorylase family protein
MEEEGFMKAVVLAGGKGARLAPYTKILPKPLMPIDDMPILEVLLRQMKKCGVEEVTLTVGHLSELLKAFFQDGSQWGLNIRYSYEEQPLGTAGPIALVDGLQQTFLVTNGDVLTTLSFKEVVDFHRSQGAIATIASHKREVRIDLGVLQRDGGCGPNGDRAMWEACSYRDRCQFWRGGCLVIGYNEKPTFDYVVSMGVYVFEPEVLAYIPKNEYLDFPNLVLKLIAAGEKVVSFPFDGYWMDLGRPDDYAQAAEDFARMREQFLPEATPPQPSPKGESAPQGQVGSG